MDLRAKSRLIARILSGQVRIKYNNKVYIHKQPSADMVYLAEEIYEDIVEDNKFQDWITDQEIVRLLIESGLWTPESDNNLKVIAETIEDIKVEIYRSMFSVEKVEGLRKRLRKVEEKQAEMLTIRHSYDHYTLHGYASDIREKFLFAISLSVDGVPFCSPHDFDDIDCGLLDNIFSCYNQQALTIKTIREIARTNPWRDYWALNKMGVFGKPFPELNDEQRYLSIYSSMYESINSHPECPGDEVINDDDMLDGWMISQRRESERGRKEKEIESILGKGKLKDASEIFLVANNKEDVKKIHELNTEENKMRIKQRQQYISAKGEVKDQNLPDNRLQINMQANRKFADKMRKKG